MSSSSLPNSNFFPESPVRSEHRQISSNQPSDVRSRDTSSESIASLQPTTFLQAMEQASGGLASLEIIPRAEATGYVAPTAPPSDAYTPTHDPAAKLAAIPPILRSNTSTGLSKAVSVSSVSELRKRGNSFSFSSVSKEEKDGANSANGQMSAINSGKVLHPMPTTFSSLSKLLEANKNWSAAMVKKNPRFFTKLANQQTPQLLWIGCSDSRVPANQIVNLAPGEVFVHRNVGNVVGHNCLNVLSVIQYAVDVLHVKHIIVCGHYGCGGVLAALSSKQYGLIDNWLRNIKDVCQSNAHKLDMIQDEKAKADLLCELNVMASVRNVCATTIVQNAWARKQELSIHAWCYRIDDGIIRDLNFCISSPESMEKVYMMTS